MSKIIGRGTAWSSEDLEIVRNNYEKLNIVEINKLLSKPRTRKAIIHKAQIMGVRKIENHVDNYEKIKYKKENQITYKLCKECKRYLPLEFLYFPRDNSCTDGFRNVCKECKGENFAISSSYVWTEEENKIMRDNYPHMTNRQLRLKYFPHLRTIQLSYHAQAMGLYKTKEAMRLTHIEKNKVFKLAEKTSARMKALQQWVGSKNPHYKSNRVGSKNPNYRNGISSLYEELRRNIKQWKIDSMRNCNYRCIFTGMKFGDVHHLYAFESIIKDTLIELNLPIHENITEYSSDELRLIINKCLEIHYRHPLGVCLHKKIHELYHSSTSFRGSTPQQFEEFITRVKSGEFDEFLKENNLKLII